MKKIATVMEKRPNYYRHQLLLEDDFLAEQRYHVEARRRHALHVHGWGVVRGFRVVRASARSISIEPGYAIDEEGNEISISDVKTFDLEDFGPNECLSVILSYAEEVEFAGAPHVHQSKCDCYAILSVLTHAHDLAGVPLAMVRLDERGEVNEKSIDYTSTKYIRILGPGSITPDELHERVKRGWMRMPLRLHPVVNIPEGETELPPAFRVGVTEALSPDHKDAGGNDRGAAGTLSIPLPPNATHVTRMRIAGSTNEGEIQVQLIKGGWIDMKHFRRVIIDATITDGPFLETYKVESPDTVLDPKYHTLALWLRGSRRTSLSLIAVELSYW